MTLGQLKKATMQLIEEYVSGVTNYTDDEDISAKLTMAINACVNEVSQARAIIECAEYVNLGEKMDLPSDFRSLRRVFVNGEQTHIYTVYPQKKFVVYEKGNVMIEYEAIPPTYSDTTAENTILPLDDDACSVLPFGVAKIIFMTTGRTEEATECETKYYTMLNQLERTARVLGVKITSMRDFSL